MAVIRLTKKDLEDLVQDTYGDGNVKWIRGGGLRLTVIFKADAVHQIGFGGEVGDDGTICRREKKLKR